MFLQITGKPLDLTCTEPAFPEFPDLLFGNETDSGASFFDATDYIQKKQLSIAALDFFSKYEEPIKKLTFSYGIEPTQICKLNHQGHHLIDGNLVYLFISFVEPDFLAYMCDRIHELFTNGFCISDTHLVQAAKNRLTKDVLGMITENGNNQQ